MSQVNVKERRIENKRIAREKELMNVLDSFDLEAANDDVQILMVDDDIADIYLTKRRLSDANISNAFIHESDPRRLFDTLSEIRADGRFNPNVVILMDINMPHLNGMELLRALRAKQRYSKIPVIMLCNSDEVGDMLDSYQDGADGYLTKPIQTDELLAFLDMKRVFKHQLVQ